MKTPPLLLSLLIAVCLAPATGWADGIFLAPKFVWDKHRDINEPTQKAMIVYDAGQEDLILTFNSRNQRSALPRFNVLTGHAFNGAARNQYIPLDPVDQLFTFPSVPKMTVV